MVRIRYVGEQLIARAFDHIFHSERWDEHHGLEPPHVAILTANPQFEVEGDTRARGVSNGAADDGPVA